MPAIPKPKKKTKAEKTAEKIAKRRKLESKWRKNALEKKTQNKGKQKKGKEKKAKKQIKHTKTWYRKKLDTLFSQYIRLRDKRCQKCGKETGLQCSHVIPRSNYLLRWDEQNAKALCIKCHLYWWHKDILAAKEWFDGKFPDRSKYLASKRNLTSSLTLEDYQNMYDDYKLKVKALS